MSPIIEGTKPFKVRASCGHIEVRRMREATAGVPFTEETVIEAPRGRACGVCELTRDQFNSYESGNIIAGIKHSIRTDLGLETHECYQFYTLEDVQKVALGLMARDDVKSVEIVTHKGEYKGMKPLYIWRAAQ